jgi:NAD+ synthase (glutamine-hydrolysing)
VMRNEFKRRQAAPGPKVTRRAFGRERRYPITSGWRP